MKREIALDILRQYKTDNLDKYGILSMGIFGSVARDEAQNSSDVDVCIQTKVPNMFNIIHIKDELQTLFSTKVDIIRVRDKMNPFLKKRIEKDAIYV
ncbi:MAG: nucleotidyltransferase domain-containing protein [Sulfurovum sp.]|nr:nucleotidyltransferase domain-containing protein [Sulfurovum sp.]